MPKPRPRVQEPPDGDEEPQDYFPPDLEFANKRDELLGENEGGSIRVYREGPGGYRDLTFVRGFSLTEFQPEMLQAPPFNGGRFRIHMLGTGQGGMRANFLFKVEPLPGAKPLDPITLQPTVATGTETAVILAAIKEGFAAIAAAMHPQKQGMGVEDTIKLIGALNGLQDRNVPRGGDDGMGAIEKFSKFVEVFEDIRGPVDGDGKVSMLSVFSRALDKIAEPLGDVLATVAQKRLSKSPGAAALVDAAGEIVTTTGAETVNLNEQLKVFLPMLIAQAAADNDPATYAEMLLDNVQLDAIQPWIGRSDWFEELEKLDARVKPYRKWFTELHEIIAEGLTPSPEGGTKADSSLPGPGDATPGGAKPDQ